MKERKETILVILLLCVTIAAPSQANIEVEGAKVHYGTADEVVLWAYSPTVSFKWTGGDARFILGNVAPARLAVEPELDYEVISPTTIAWRAKGPQELSIRTLTPELTFAVVGDSQGRNQVLSLLIEEINAVGADFLIHLGDMTPAGGDDEYWAFLETMAKLQCPYYPVLGNHDVKFHGREIFQEIYGPLHHCFDQGEWRFIFLDSSSHGLDEDQLEWLAEAIKARPSLIFTHVPHEDPRGEDHGFLDGAAAGAFASLLREGQVAAVFTGHVHMFHQQTREGITFVTSGGGGAPLVAPPEEGGYHHFLLVEPDRGMKITPYAIDLPPYTWEVVVAGKEGEILFCPEELAGWPILEGESAYENRFGNITGRGRYRGVLVRELLDRLGGMEPEDVLVVHADDGYAQEFAYANVYPGHLGWEEIQGEMILAFAYEGLEPPDWQEGCRIAFLPPDGIYHNDDCASTSVPGQGWHLDPSAGARWVKNVVRLEVVSK